MEQERLVFLLINRTSSLAIFPASMKDFNHMSSWWVSTASIKRQVDTKIQLHIDVPIQLPDTNHDWLDEDIS